jgi:hypothetical protein
MMVEKKYVGVEQGDGTIKMALSKGEGAGCEIISKLDIMRFHNYLMDVYRGMIITPSGMAHLMQINKKQVGMMLSMIQMHIKEDFGETLERKDGKYEVGE